MHFGTPTAKEKEMYTRVLLGNLSLERIKLGLDASISGSNIDSIARQFLWHVNSDFKHGTGHGVGHFLNVHEGPQGISSKNTTQLKHGMTITNEPGYYEAGNFGIRIENIMIVTEKEDRIEFVNVTCVPYEKELIDMRLISQDVRDYINAYHDKVYLYYNCKVKEILTPLLENDKISLEYLLKKTRPI